MNQMKYANFRELLNSGVRSNSVLRTDTILSVSAGIWSLRLLSTEGFAGLKRIEQELGSNMNSVFPQDDSVVGYETEEDYFKELRSYVREEVKGMFHH